MKLAFTKLFSFRLLVALFTTGVLLATLAVGCGDDDDDDGAPDASVTGGSGGAGGSTGTAGKGGSAGSTSTAGKGGGGGTGGTTTGMSTTECNALLTSTSSATSKCMCQNCAALWGPCIKDTNCVAFMTCVAKTGCSGAACIEPAACQNEYVALQGSNAALGATLTDIGTCRTSKCTTPADSGI